MSRCEGQLVLRKIQAIKPVGVGEVGPREIRSRKISVSDTRARKRRSLETAALEISFD